MKNKKSSLVNNGTIRSDVPTDAYRDNWDRIFVKKSDGTPEEEDRIFKNKAKLAKADRAGETTSARG